MEANGGGAPDVTAPDPWIAFARAGTAGQMDSAWLGALCGMFPAARAGVLLRGGLDEGFAPVALWPGGTDLEHLGPVAQRALEERSGVVERQADGRVRLAYPLLESAQPVGAVVLELSGADDAAVTGVMRQVHWGAGWLAHLQAVARNAQLEGRVERAAFVFETVMAVLGEPRFGQATLMAANRVAQRFGAQRAVLGMASTAGMEVVAVSHSAWFDTRSNLLQRAAEAMDDACDLRRPLVHPVAGDAGHETGAGPLAAYVREAGSLHALVLPVGDTDGMVAAWIVERDRALEAADVEALEACAMSLAPVLAIKREGDESLWAHARRSLRDGLMRITDTSRPGLKLAALALAVVVALLALVPTDFRVATRAVVEGGIQRVAVAPFQGYLREAPVRAGDVVRRDQVLAVLDDRDLLLERVRYESEMEVAQRRASEAMAKSDRAAYRTAAAQADQARAQLELTLEKLSRARVSAPFDAVVVRGDLMQELGSPVEQGKVLFELAPLESWRVILKVDERDIAHLRPGATGEVVLTSLPGERMRLSVKRITPVSTAEEGRNYFRVEADVPEGMAKLRPGMEGVAKVEAGRHSLLWIWSRRLLDWARLMVWEYTP